MSTTQPEALLIAEECQRRSEDSRYERNLFRRAAAELRRLHAYAAELESQVIADCMAGGAGGVSPLMGAAGDAGWVMVPVDPTPEMCAVASIDEGARITDGPVFAAYLYSAMLAASPTPPAQAADSVLEDAARESEYQRGYRQGYEQRDAEVRGALV